MASGDIAWVLTSTALVMLMTPALGFFYGGLVRKKNLVSTIVQCFVIFAVISIVWALWGYSLVFGQSIGGVIGFSPGLLGMGSLGIHRKPSTCTRNPRITILCIPAKVRRHHTSPNHRCMRRTNPLQITTHLHGTLVNPHLRANRTLGLEPRRLAKRLRRN